MGIILGVTLYLFGFFLAFYMFMTWATEAFAGKVGKLEMMIIVVWNVFLSLFWFISVPYYLRP